MRKSMHAWLGTAKMLGASLFSVVGIVSAVLAIWTMLPEEASKPCFLGYEAYCSFAPVSTIILFVVAAVLVLLGLRMLKK